VIDSIRRHGMVPTVTLHHFTNPIWAERLGGWENPEMPKWLGRFAAHVVREIGDRVDVWWTINEPMIAPALCYLGGVHPPCVRDFGRAMMVSRHVLLAHGEMYAAIHEAARHAVRAGPVHAMPYFEPFDPGCAEDRAATSMNDHLMNEYFLVGLRDGIVAAPVGDDREVPGLKNSFDLIGVNYYMRILTRAGAAALDTSARRPNEPDRFADEMGWEVYPAGLTRNLERVGALGRPVYVTENGMATVDDDARTAHMFEHLSATWNAIRAGVDVRGFFYWSLLDNFEWAEGYSRRFGLVAVDRQTLRRTVRPTATIYRGIIGANALELEE